MSEHVVERYLSGQVALVTGAAQGNGRAIAVELGRRGADGASALPRSSRACAAPTRRRCSLSR